jgi:hypothetical protein
MQQPNNRPGQQSIISVSQVDREAILVDSWARKFKCSYQKSREQLPPSIAATDSAEITSVNDC